MADNTDYFSFFWKFLGSTVIGTLFSVATVFAVSFLNTVNSSLAIVSTNCTTLQGSIGQVQGQVTGQGTGLQSLRTDHNKLSDTFTTQSMDNQKQLADFRERITRLEDKVKELEAKLSAATKPPELNNKK